MEEEYSEYDPDQGARDSRKEMAIGFQRNGCIREAMAVIFHSVLDRWNDRICPRQRGKEQCGVKTVEHTNGQNLRCGRSSRSFLAGSRRNQDDVVVVYPLLPDVESAAFWCLILMRREFLNIIIWRKKYEQSINCNRYAE